LRSLGTNWSNLIELVDSKNGLVDEMFQAEGISFRQKEQTNDPNKKLIVIAYVTRQNKM